MISTKSVLLLLSFAVGSAYSQCTLTVSKPVNLLSAEGLATPWILSGPCSMADPNTQGFIEATIYQPGKKTISAYSPLVINAGTEPLARPVLPDIDADAIMVYHFGSNANTQTLADSDNGNTLKNAFCVNGVPGSVFGQFAYCNAPAFFKATRPNITPPPLGKALDGTPCPTTRSFSVVDQDQSDNVNTAYLLVGNRTAQNNTMNMKKFKGATVVANPSDNLLLSRFIDPALGCKPFAIPALDNPGQFRPTVASDELSAAARQGAPVALVPDNDPMVLNNAAIDFNKVNAYRIGVDQPLVNVASANGKRYCLNMGKFGAPVILHQGIFTSKFTSPLPAQGDTLFTFLGSRFNASWTNLGCFNLTGMPSPIIANVNGAGVAVNLTFFINGEMFGPTAVGGNIKGTPTDKIPPATSPRGPIYTNTHKAD